MGEHVYISYHGSFVTNDPEEYERLKAEIRKRARKEGEITLLVLLAFFAVPVQIIVGLFGLTLFLGAVSSCL